MRTRTQQLAILALGALAAAGAPAAEQLLDGIAAQVGSDIVLISEVRQRSEPIERQMELAGAAPTEIARLRADILESLIERALIRQLVRRSELGASDDEVDAAIAAIGRENELTFEQLRQNVESQGLSFDAYREQIRGQIEHSKVLNSMVASRVSVSDEEIRQLYDEQFADQPASGDEVHLRHLLVPMLAGDASAREVACARARQARQRILGGEEFVFVAAEVSPVNPDLGWMHVQNLAGWMAPAVASLSPGQISEPLETSFGCNLLQLVERRSYQQISFEEARDPLRKRVFDERMRDEYLRFIERLRGKTFVERKGYFAEAARLGEPEPAAPEAGGASP